MSDAYTAGKAGTGGTFTARPDGWRLLDGLLAWKMLERERNDPEVERGRR